MVLTKGKKTIELPDSRNDKIQNYINAGWVEVKTKKTKVETPAEPVEELNNNEENEDGSDSW